MTETCVCCGAEIPEGRQTCPGCESKATNTKGRNAMKIKISRSHPNAMVPTYATPEAAGLALYVSQTPHALHPGETVYVHTGVHMAIPDGYVGLLFARSGMATHRGLAPANKVGVIDSDYRGEIVVALHNHTDKKKHVDVGERVAQLVIVPYIHAELEEVGHLPSSLRGAGGFGSTGE